MQLASPKQVGKSSNWEHPFSQIRYVITANVRLGFLPPDCSIPSSSIEQRVKCVIQPPQHRCRLKTKHLSIVHVNPARGAHQSQTENVAIISQRSLLRKRKGYRKSLAGAMTTLEHRASCRMQSTCNGRRMVLVPTAAIVSPLPLFLSFYLTRDHKIVSGTELLYYSLSFPLRSYLRQ